MNNLSAEEICLLVGNRIKDNFPESPVTYANSIRGRFDENGNFFIIVPDSFSAGRFMNKFRPIIEEIIHQFCGIESYEVEVDPQLAVRRDESTPGVSILPDDGLSTGISGTLPENEQGKMTIGEVPNIGLNPKYTMSSFIVGDSNRFAHAVSLAVTASPGETFNPLFFYGGVGLGKTHLMQAIGHSLAEGSQTSGRLVAYRTSEVFCNEYIEALKKNNVEAFRKKYREAEALLIDDVQFFCGKEKMLEEFHHTFNELYQSGRQIIMTSDRTPSELRNMPERLISRFKSGIVTEISKPDLETRLAILKKLASSHSVTPSFECLECIARKVTENIRELEGAFIKVMAMSSVMNVPFSVSMIEEVLAGFAQERKPRVITLQSIKETICSHFTISMEELVGKRRQKRVVVPRQIAMYLSYDLTDHTLQAIGESFGGRDHTTVVHACNKMEKEIDTETSVSEEIKVLRIKLRETVERK